MIPLASAHDEYASTPAEGSASLRDRKKQMVRATIADSALALFADQGFDETTVNEVAERAGVSPATVARYFPSKESMLFVERDQRIAQLRAAILDRPRREAPFTAVVEALAGQATLDEPSRVRLLRARQAIARSSVLRGRASTLLDEWREGIADAIVERSGLSADDARTLATVVVAVLDDSAARWCEAGGKSDIAADTRRAFDSLERSRRRIP